MRIILSPTKTMKIATEGNTLVPIFIKRAEELREYLKGLSYNELKKIWKCNDKLINENIEGLNKYKLDSNLTPAIYAYDGLQYKNIMAGELDSASLDYLSSRLRIISAMYGVLRPADGIIPYRLEMQAPIELNGYKSLYEYWGSSIYDELTSNNDLIINLCSKEYSEAIAKYKKPGVRIITIGFYSVVAGKLKVKGTLAKMLRGRLVRYMAINKIDDIEGIKSFSELGFSYSEANSSDDMINFVEN